MKQIAAKWPALVLWIVLFSLLLLPGYYACAQEIDGESAEIAQSEPAHVGAEVPGMNPFPLEVIIEDEETPSENVLTEEVPAPSEDYAFIEEEPGESDPPAAVHAEAIHVRVDGGRLSPGQQGRAWVEVSPEQALLPPIAWSSSDASLVRVDEEGKLSVASNAVVPQDGAEVDIWARTTDGSLLMNCVTIKVVPQVRSLNLMRDSIVLKSDDDAFVAVAVGIEPAYLTGLVRVEWSSSNEAVARVEVGKSSEVALIYAGIPGEARITATALDGSGCSDSLNVSVE